MGVCQGLQRGRTSPVSEQQLRGVYADVRNVFYPQKQYDFSEGDMLSIRRWWLDCCWRPLCLKALQD
ncbi:unnamed protein product [Gadus morhua 'NCC']